VLEPPCIDVGLFSLSQAIDPIGTESMTHGQYNVRLKVTFPVLKSIDVKDTGVRPTMFSKLCVTFPFL